MLSFSVYAERPLTQKDELYCSRIEFDAIIYLDLKNDGATFEWQKNSLKHVDGNPDYSKNQYEVDLKVLQWVYDGWTPSAIKQRCLEQRSLNIWPVN